MKNIIYLFTAVFLLNACGPVETEMAQVEKERKSWAIAIHGGAGGMERGNFTEAEIEDYSNSLSVALRLGEEMLKEGRPGVEVIEEVISVLEDDSLFNAGKGAVMTAGGHAELDASIMDGESRNCGAVTGLQNIKNPIKAARLVMDSSVHVFFSGAGASRFALSHGLEWVDSTYFETERRMNQFEQRRDKATASIASWDDRKFGTVGCVVLDKNGNLGAGTSTGGMSMKRNGRIGDSPMIGAGTYADNKTCAVSCTGWGEYFIRAAVAHDVHARMAYGEEPLKDACYEVIQNVVPNLGGDGGLIAIDSNGVIVMEFDTKGMFRACSDSEGLREVKIFKN